MVNPDRNLYEPPYDDALLYESDLEPERPRSRPLVVLLGIVVLAAFAGVVWVAYNQGVKHGQGGTPPILSAESGPTRIPADPTTVAEPKDVAADKSYDRLFGDASDQPENVLPPAEQPRTVASSEGPPSAPQEVTSSQGGPAATVMSDIPPPVDPRMDSTTGVSGSTDLASASPQPISSAPPTPLSSGSEDITAALPAATAPKPVTATKPATPRIVLGPAKPAVTAAAPIAPPPAAAVDTPAPEIAAVETPVPALATSSESPARASGGGVSIQLGSFPNDKLAAGAWSKIKSANQDLLGAYSPTIKAAQIDGKGTWYRLRVGGFADKSAAADVCEQLKATGQACIIASK